MPNSLTPALWLEGFLLPRDRIPPQIANAMYDLLFGISRRKSSTTELRTKATQCLQSILDTCLLFEAEYSGTLGDLNYWQHVADSNDNVPDTLSARDLKDITMLWVAARKDWIATKVDSPLTRMADLFIAMEARATERQPLALAVQAMDEYDQRPVQHFNIVDHKILSAEFIRNSLGDISPAHKDEYLIELPTKHTLGSDLELFLAYMALTEYTDDCGWSLFPTPVAFFHNELRRTWFQASGGESRSFGHLNQFLSSLQASTFDGKRMVVGLFTPWFGTLGDLEASSGNWQMDPTTARYGIVLAIRYAAHARQIFVLDPMANYGHLLDMTGSPGGFTAIDTFRCELVTKVAAWLKERCYLDWPLEIWCGGMLRYARLNDNDPVTICAQFLQEAVKGHGLNPSDSMEEPAGWRMEESVGNAEEDAGEDLQMDYEAGQGGRTFWDVAFRPLNEFGEYI